MANQGMLFDFDKMAFKNFRWEVANKNPLSTKSVIAEIEIFR